jgi:hypothetical protein
MTHIFSLSLSLSLSFNSLLIRSPPDLMVNLEIYIYNIYIYIDVDKKKKYYFSKGNGPNITSYLINLIFKSTIGSIYITHITMSSVVELSLSLKGQKPLKIFENL